MFKFKPILKELELLRRASLAGSVSVFQGFTEGAEGIDYGAEDCDAIRALSASGLLGPVRSEWDKIDPTGPRAFRVKLTAEITEAGRRAATIDRRERDATRFSGL